MDWSSVGLTASREKWRLSKKEWRMTRDVVVVIPATSLTCSGRDSKYLTVSDINLMNPSPTASMPPSSSGG